MQTENPADFRQPHTPGGKHLFDFGHRTRLLLHLGLPQTAAPEQITLLEEEKICAYYGAGTLYATPQRSEPLI